MGGVATSSVCQRCICEGLGLGWQVLDSELHQQGELNSCTGSVPPDGLVKMAQGCY